MAERRKGETFTHIITLIMIVQPVGMYPGKYSLSSSPGDCSLSLQEVDIRLDDGQWQCQVTI